ncbi:Uncharacterised protein [Mycobacteroides abscessus subsp. abscessus]|nr:Uncharacterised protein [Mycobacteroides abscessus subsp. abscessus]
MGVIDGRRNPAISTGTPDADTSAHPTTGWARNNVYIASSEPAAMKRSGPANDNGGGRCRIRLPIRSTASTSTSRPMALCQASTIG